MATKFDGAVIVDGRLTPKQLDIPAGACGDAAIPAGANVNPEKMSHQYRAGVADNSGTTTATFTRTLFRARGAGKLKDLVAGNVVPCVGAATIVVDMKKNNTSVLSSTLTLNNSNTARVAVAATLNPALTTLAAGDWIEIVATATAGGGTLGQGFFADATIQDEPVI